MTDQGNGDDPLQWLDEERRHGGGSRTEFREQLESVNTELVEVSDAVAEAIVPVTRAFLEADRDTVDAWLARADQVTSRSVELEESCYLLLARQSPVAGELRRVVATIRSVNDVERSANLLSHVGRSLDWVHPPSMSEDIRDTTLQLGITAGEVFSGAVEAWRVHDGLAAVELQRSDDQVDLLQKVLLSEIYTGRQSVEESVSLALIARYFERVADHGVEMARQVTYFLTGERISLA